MYRGSDLLQTGGGRGENKNDGTSRSYSRIYRQQRVRVPGGTTRPSETRQHRQGAGTICSGQPDGSGQMGLRGSFRVRRVCGYNHRIRQHGPEYDQRQDRVCVLRYSGHPSDHADAEWTWSAAGRTVQQGQPAEAVLQEALGEQGPQHGPHHHPGTGAHVRHPGHSVPLCRGLERHGGALLLFHYAQYYWLRGLYHWYPREEDPDGSRTRHVPDCCLRVDPDRPLLPVSRHQVHHQRPRTERLQGREEHAQTIRERDRTVTRRAEEWRGAEFEKNQNHEEQSIKQQYQYRRGQERSAGQHQSFITQLDVVMNYITTGLHYTCTSWYQAVTQRTSVAAHYVFTES